jgi:hypothetical protein
MIIHGQHGAYVAFEDEFTITFQLQDPSIIDAGNIYELVIMLYKPSLLKLDATAKMLSITYA